MSPRKTRRGTIRDSVSELSINKSLRSGRSLRSTHRINKSQNSKNAGDSDSLVEVNGIINNSITATNTCNKILNVKKRNRKDQEVSFNQDNTIAAIEDSETKLLSNKNNSKFKRQTRNNKSQIIDTNLPNNEAESSNIKRQNQDTNNLISENKNNPEKGKKLSNLNSASSKKECKTPEKLLETSLNKVQTTKDVTPKSDPLNVSLILHRSTKKTPKKSPINLGSPKSHSNDPLRLLNVSKKLSIVDSSPLSNKSNDSSQLLSVENTDISNKNSKSEAKHLSGEKKKKASKTFKVRPRFSKSPKIVLKSPKSNKASPKTSSSFPNLKKSPKKMSRLSSKSSPKTDLLNKSEIISSTVSLEKNIKSIDDIKSLISIEPSTIVFSSKSTKSHANVSLVKSKDLSDTVTSNTSLNNSKKSLMTTQGNSSKTSSTLKFKKSPKIITPLHSKKMPKIVLSLSKSKKSPLKKSSKSISPLKLKKSSTISFSKSRKGKSITNEISKNSSMSPKVIVNKLTSPQLRNSTLRVEKNQLSINLVPVDHPIQLNVTPEVQKISENKLSKSPKYVKSHLKGKPNSLARIVKNQLSTSQNYGTMNFSLKTDTPFNVLDKKYSNLKLSNTSTPREKFNKNGSVSKSSNTLVFNGSPIPKSKVVKQLNNYSKLKTNNALLDDESEPFMDNSSLIPMSDVFDSDTSQNNTFDNDKSNLKVSFTKKSTQDLNVSQKSNKSDVFGLKKRRSNTSSKEKSEKNNSTYEIEHSETVGFQKNSNKRKINETEFSKNEGSETRKHCRVHFGNSNLKNKEKSSGIVRMSTPGHAIQRNKTSVPKSKTPKNQALLNKRENKRQSLIQTKTPVNKRNLNSSSDSRNRLSKSKSIIDSEKKSEIKTPAARKIPNFAEIHQKNFAKMESLVDLKKRVQKRHVSLNTASSSTKKINPLDPEKNNPVPSDSTNGTYNRFGFKLRKNDAINLISKKPTSNIESREKKRENVRSTLKGVRMNRRFELQMQARMKNS